MEINGIEFEITRYERQRRFRTWIGFNMEKMKAVVDDVNGRVAVPILLYLMGVPGIIVLLLWAFFFRGK
tara:strand:+ start:6496 stop:6702 length:207 start_codon:yes stop_codon:yes gene_type:complete